MTSRDFVYSDRQTEEEERLAVLSLPLGSPRSRLLSPSVCAGDVSSMAVATAGGSRSYNFKIVLLGEGCVGKTSLVLRYVEDKFNDRHITTLQVMGEGEGAALDLGGAKGDSARPWGRVGRVGSLGGGGAAMLGQRSRQGCRLLGVSPLFE